MQKVDIDTTLTGIGDLERLCKSGFTYQINGIPEILFVYANDTDKSPETKFNIVTIQVSPPESGLLSSKTESVTGNGIDDALLKLVKLVKYKGW